MIAIDRENMRHAHHERRTYVSERPFTLITIATFVKVNGAGAGE